MEFLAWNIQVGLQYGACGRKKWNSTGGVLEVEQSTCLHSYIGSGVPEVEFQSGSGVPWNAGSISGGGAGGGFCPL